ncbi:MAG: fibronectin type III domain-containing protein, partial [Bacteroidaceae bacterium]|nr:fibronectin type III domain-containing protein [Bacteroidaceae bacterium]
NIDPELIPGHTYAWRVRAVAMDGIDEVGVFDNDGYSETGWFRLVRGCDAPVIDRAEAGYRKLDLGWHGSAGDMRYTVQYSTEKENGSYNWTDTTTLDNETTLYGLTPGATYSYRVGALCSATGKPVYSQIGTVQIPTRDSISAANCGVKPEYKELGKEKKTDLKVGDRVTVGGDYSMLITELNSKGDGVYSGKGRLTFTWVFFVGLEVTFDDLVINTDGYQIGGTVNTVYDSTNANIANLDQLNDGGVSNRESRMSVDGRSTVMDFSVPPMPRSDLSEDGDSVIVYDLSGAPHTIEIPKNAGGGQSIPFSLTDRDGNTWRFESCDSVVTDSLTGNQKTVHGIRMTKLDAVSGFSKDKLSDKVKARIAFANGGFYAFDDLRGKYYDRSSKLGKDYLDKSSLGDGTFAPWKLVPMGKTDKIKAGLNPTKIDIDIASVRFVDADGHDLESSYDSDNAVWTVNLTAAATEGDYYNVYAVAKPKDGKGSYQTIGKLFVVSYKTTKADIVLLPVEKHDCDISKLNAEISDIFAPCGVEINITESDALVGNTGWDLNGDGKLSLTNDAETDNVKRSAEMKALEDIVKSMPGYDKNVLYLVYVPKGSKSSGADVEGNWGRGRQIGYVFENLDARTVAHEVGHAFTLQHTFDRQYGGNETRCKTKNLMDYTDGTQLDAFQWEILAHNAPKIVASVVDGAEDNWIVENVGKIKNVGRGLTPDGKVIVSVTTNPDVNGAGEIVYSLGDKSNSIYGFYVYYNGEAQNYYEWSPKDSCYVSKKFKTKIDEAKDIVITYYKSNQSNKSTIVNKVKIFNYLSGDPCFYKYAIVKYDVSEKRVTTEKPKWYTGLLYNASDSCKAYIEKYSSRFSECTAEKTQYDLQSLQAVTEKTIIDDLVGLIDTCCIEVLNSNDISFEKKARWITRIVEDSGTEKKAGVITRIVKDWGTKSRLAIIRLMSVIKPNSIKNDDECIKFCDLLMQNSNKLLFDITDCFNDYNLHGKLTVDGYIEQLGRIYRELPCSKKKEILKGIASHNTLGETYERVILTFIENLKPEEYSDFYKLFEENGNALIKKFVDGIHDVGFYGTDDNYTYFTKLLCKMCKHLYAQDSFWQERNMGTGLPVISLGKDLLFDNTQNTKVKFQGYKPCKYRYNFSYNSDSGTVNVYKVVTYENEAVQYKEEYLSEISLSECVAENLSPMTPIFVSMKDKLPLIETALGENDNDTIDWYVVPAITLQYIYDKERNHNIEVGTYVALDLITLATATPVAVASKVMWVRRIWAATEALGAIGNIAANSGNVSKEFQTALDAYNAICGLIGAKNIAKSATFRLSEVKLKSFADIKRDFGGCYDKLKKALRALKKVDSEKFNEGFFDELYNYLKNDKKIDGANATTASKNAESAAKGAGNTANTVSDAAKTGKTTKFAELNKKIDDIVKKSFKSFEEKFREENINNVDERLEEFRRKIENGNFENSFRKAYKNVTRQGAMYDVEVILGDFHKIISDYGDKIDGKGLLCFLEEMFQTEDKFKVGTTTIYALDNFIELCKAKGWEIRNIKFEDIIVDGKLQRFDVCVETAKKKLRYIETKNYRSASQVFCKTQKGIVEVTPVFKQFKTYLGVINSFDELLYVFQKRGFKVETAINNLKKAIANDAEAAFEANKNLWETVGVTSPTQLSLEALNANKKFNDAIKNCIKLTD